MPYSLRVQHNIPISFFCTEGTCLEMPLNKGYAEKFDVMIFYDLRYQNPKKLDFGILHCNFAPANR